MKNFERDSAYKNHTVDTTHSYYTNKHKRGIGTSVSDVDIDSDSDETTSSKSVGKRSKSANASRKAVAAKHTAGNNTVSKVKRSSSSQSSPATPASSHADDHVHQRASTISTTTKGNGATRRSQAASVQPTLRTIDKAFIDATPTASQIETAIEVCHDLRREGRATQITTQSRFWGAMFNIPLDPNKDADHSKNPSVTLCFESQGKNSNVAFQLQLNPHKFSQAHTTQLIHLWESLFPIGYRDVRGSARFSRVDEAADFHGRLDNLIFDRKASQTREHYYVRTDRHGLIQTVYMGEATAATHGTIYDRHLAELFRNFRGEIAPLNEETATQILRQLKDVVRVESRRLPHPKLTYRELAELPSSFHEYNLFDLSRLTRKDIHDPAFMHYVELVRLRGLHGARHRLLELHGKSANTKRSTLDFQDRLARTQCEWWTTLDHTQQLCALLESLPINKFLRKIGSR